MLIKVDLRELSTVLAALRCYQCCLDGDTIIVADSFADIASDGETLVPMSADEIDTLCERINAGGSTDETVPR